MKPVPRLEAALSRLGAFLRDSLRKKETWKGILAISAINAGTLLVWAYLFVVFRTGEGLGEFLFWWLFWLGFIQAGWVWPLRKSAQAAGRNDFATGILLGAMPWLLLTIAIYVGSFLLALLIWLPHRSR